MRTLPPFLLVALVWINGCLLLRGGHATISPAVRSQYDHGVGLYQQGRFAEAEQVLRQVLAADGRAVLVRYWIGLSLYQQGKAASARKEFYHIVSLSPRLPHGYYGLGLVALRGQNRRINAIDWFREALKRDPRFVEAQWQLALTRLTLTGGLFGAFTMGEVRREFERVIALVPDHPEAYYILGTTYYEYGKSDDAAAAIPLFERQVAVNTAHREARYQLGLAYMDVGRMEDGITALTALARLDHDWDVRVNQAIAEAQLRTGMVSADSLERLLHLLPVKEQRLYFDLRSVLPSGQGTGSDSQELDEVEATAHRYWKEHDPTPATEWNERFAEHCRRVAYARRYFGRGQWPWDRRGDVYIRFGEPAVRRVYLADAATGLPAEAAPVPSGDALTSQLGIRQAEHWVYVSPPAEFDFVDQASNFVYDTPLPAASGDVASQAEQAGRDAGVLADDLTSKSPALYPAESANGPPIKFSYSLAVFRGPDGRGELEVDYAVPAAELAFTPQGPEAVASIQTAVVVSDETWQEVTKTVEHAQVYDQTGGTQRAAQVALYRRTLSVPPGQHHVAIQVTDLRSRRIGVSRQPLRIEAYPPDRLAMSDLRLATTVEPASGGAFVRAGRRLVPNPAGVYTRTRPIIVYFEVYNLQNDAAGQTALSIDYTLMPLSGAHAAAARKAGGRELILHQEEQGTDDTVRRDVTLDLAGYPPGRYLLRVSVTDANRAEQTEKTVSFQIVR